LTCAAVEVAALPGCCAVTMEQSNASGIISFATRFICSMTKPFPLL